MVIRGRIKNGMVVLDADAVVPEGAEVSVMVPVVQPPDHTLAEAERHRISAIMDRIADMPDECPGDTFSGADHDRVLYGAP